MRQTNVAQWARIRSRSIGPSLLRETISYASRRRSRTLSGSSDHADPDPEFSDVEARVSIYFTEMSIRYPEGNYGHLLLVAIMRRDFRAKAAILERGPVQTRHQNRHYTVRSARSPGVVRGLVGIEGGVVSG